MIVVTTKQGYNKEYEIRYEIYKGSKVYINTIVVSNPQEYYNIINNILDAQIEILKG